MSRGREKLRSLLLARLGELMEPERAKIVLHDALMCEQMDDVPQAAWELRGFVGGTLQRVAGIPLNGFESVFQEAVRLRLRGYVPVAVPTPEVGARVLVLSVDPAIVDALRLRLGPGVELSRVTSVFGLSPLTEIGAAIRPALVVDVPFSPVALPSLARMTRLIPRECAISLIGVRNEDRARLRSLFGRFHRCAIVCGGVDSLEFSVGTPLGAAL